MRRNCRSITTSPEIVKHIDGLTEANFNLLTRLVPWLAENEKAQRKFRAAVLVNLSKIEATLTQVLGCQLAQYWPEGKVTDAQRAKYIKDVEEWVSSDTEQLGLKMVRYIYGPSDEAVVPRDRRRKWHGWEI